LFAADVSEACSGVNFSLGPKTFDRSKGQCGNARGNMSVSAGAV
jgi:hypothetical protein